MNDVKVIKRGKGRRSATKLPSPDAPAKRPGRPPKAKVVPEVVEGLTAGHEVQQVALTDIDLTDKTWQFRVSLRVKDLVDSIQKNGQQLPVILRRVPGKNELQIISGFRRCTAVSQIGWPSVHAIVLDDIGDEAAFRLSVLENEKRKTYSDLDRAHAITKYRKMGYTVSNIAEHVFGLSRKQVERLQKLVELPDFMKEAIADERLATTQALILKQLHDKHGGDHVDLTAWTEKAATESLSVRDLRAAVLSGVPEKNQSEALYSTTKKEGKTILRLKARRLDVESMSDEDRDAAIGDLENILSQLRR